MTTRELIEGIANGELEARDIRPYLTNRSDAKAFAFSLFCSTESGEVYFVETNQDEIDDDDNDKAVHDEWMEDIQARGLTIEQEKRNDRIYKAIAILEEYYGFRLFEDEPADSEIKKFPNELNNEEAMEWFAKAVEYGLMNEEYEWLKGEEDLAYFCAKMSGALEMSKRMVNGKYTVNWTPFANLFHRKSKAMATNLNTLDKVGRKSANSTIIDEIEKDLLIG